MSQQSWKSFRHNGAEEQAVGAPPSFAPFAKRVGDGESLVHGP